MTTNFNESYVEFRRGSCVYVVDNGALNFYRSAAAANAEFPGAFDVADADDDVADADE